MNLLLRLAPLAFLFIHSLGYSLQTSQTNPGNNSATAPHLRVQLVAEETSLQPHHPIHVGFYFQMEKGWHLYWRNPGDSGEAPRIHWTLPPGWKADSLEWPTPQRIEVPPLVNFGYEGDFLLATTLHPLSSSRSNAWVPLVAHLQWLVCKETCIPGHAELELDIPISSQTPASHPDWHALFERTRKEIPRPLGQFSGKLTGVITPNTLELSVSSRSNIKGAAFFPFEPNQIENAAPQDYHADATGFSLSIKRSDQLLQSISHTAGVLVLYSHSNQAYEVDFPLTVGEKPFKSESNTVFNLFKMALFAFLGGLVLNLMPCVFPVLSLKVMSLLHLSREGRKKVRRHALIYSLGVLVSFWILVGVLLILRNRGEQLGWGFQLQSPVFISILGSILFLFGLNLLGIFEWGTSFLGIGQSLTQKDGYAGAFFTGVLATVVATPCTAPLMGSAVGFALSQSNLTCFAIFTLLALGLAFPYLLISYFPECARLLPKPGAWMETLKQIMGFFVLATVVWLMWILGIQQGSQPLIFLLIGFLGIGVGAWMLGRWPSQKVLSRVSGLIILFSILGSTSRIQPKPSSSELNWEAFSPSRLEELRKSGTPVFIDFTAAWCITCQVNEKLVFHSTEVQSEFKKLGFVLMKADWTQQDPVISRTLNQFGRSGVPMYLLYGKDGVAHLLPEIIHSGLVLREIQKLKERNLL